MITCPKCSKDNQDHYKFCLGCGAELPRDVGAEALRAADARAGHEGGAPGRRAGAGPLAASPCRARRRPRPRSRRRSPIAAAPAPASYAPRRRPSRRLRAPVARRRSAAAGGTVICPQCGHVNGPTNVFCGSCGFRLGGPAGSRPRRAAAPPPAAAEVGRRRSSSRRSAPTAAKPAPTTSRAAPSCVGRDTGGIFAGDSYLSPRHATFKQPAPGRLTVKDEGSLNGVYKKLARDTPIELKPNDVFRIGQEIIRFEPLAPPVPTPDGVERLGAPAKGYVGRIALVIGRDTTGQRLPGPRGGHPPRARARRRALPRGRLRLRACTAASPGRTGSATLTDLGQLERLVHPPQGRDRGSLGRRAPHGAAAVPRDDVSTHARTIRVVAAVLEQDGRYLITQRRATAVLPLMWEFPAAASSRARPTGRRSKREVLHRLGAADRRGQAHLVREPPLRALRRRPVPLRVPLLERAAWRRAT